MSSGHRVRDGVLTFQRSNLSIEHRELLGLNPIPPPPLSSFQPNQRPDRLILAVKPIHAYLPPLPYATPLPIERPFTKQVWHDGNPVKPGNIVSRLALFKIGLHGSEMILARNFQGFGLFGANVFFGAFNAGMTE